MHTQKRKNSMKQALLILCSGVAMLLVLAGCDSGSANDVKPTPTAETMAFVPLHLDLPAVAWNAPITGKVPDNQILHVGVTMKLNQQALDQMSKHGIAKPGDSTSANDIAQKLGISEADYQRLKQFFGVNGADLQLSQTRTSMTLDIQAGKLAQLLQTSFVQHTLDNRTFYTPDPQHQPQIPAVLAANILAVTGLDNYSLPPMRQMQFTAQQGQEETISKQATGVNCTPRAGTVGPKQLAHAYGYDELWQQGLHGENMTINLVALDATKMDDLRTYFTCTGFKGTLDFINVNGKAPKPTKGDGETTLDIEMIASMAPTAHIKVYQTENNSANVMDDVLQRIIDDNATQHEFGSSVSISWGGAEEFRTGESMKATSQHLQLLTTVEHMTIYAASGDCGAFESRIIGVLSTSYPASDPWAVSVGGTTLTSDRANNRAKETAWGGVPNAPVCADNSWGSGGGLSSHFQKPSWQQAPGVNNQFSNGKRQVPDIAALANKVSMFLDGKWISVGGTSAATPIWAAGMALVNQGLLTTKGFYVYGPDTFYTIQAHAGNLKPYYDEVEGNNLVFRASPGWDYMTGLGSPNLSAFYQVIATTMTI